MVRKAFTQCPICCEFGEFAIRINEHEIAECARCAHRYLDEQLAEDHTARHYSDDYFDGGGAGYTDYLAQEELIRSCGRRYADIVKRPNTTQRTIEEPHHGLPTTKTVRPHRQNSTRSPPKGGVVSIRNHLDHAPNGFSDTAAVLKGG